MQSSYRVCTRCVMDTSDPAIVFDENGVCNHCRAYDERARDELFSPAGGNYREAQLFC